MNTDQEKRVAAISRSPITTTPVKSSQIAELGHDPETNRLAVRFQPKAGFDVGSLYYYGNFTAENFEALSKADSIGSHFQNNIRPNSGQWPYVKIEPDTHAQDTEREPQTEAQQG